MMKMMRSDWNEEGWVEESGIGPPWKEGVCVCVCGSGRSNFVAISDLHIEGF